MHAEKRESLVKVITQCTHRHRIFTARLCKLELPGITHADQVCKKRKYTSDLWCTRFLNGACHAKSFPPDVTCMINFTTFPHFSVCIFVKLGRAWVQNYLEDGRVCSCLLFSCISVLSFGIKIKLKLSFVGKYINILLCN